MAAKKKAAKKAKKSAAKKPAKAPATPHVYRADMGEALPSEPENK